MLSTDGKKPPDVRGGDTTTGYIPGGGDRCAPGHQSRPQKVDRVDQGRSVQGGQEDTEDGYQQPSIEEAVVILEQFCDVKG